MPQTPLLAKETLAKAILATRTEKKVTGDALCDKAKISRNTLYLIEQKSANARLDTIMRLAVALGVDPCHFFGKESYPLPTEMRITNFRRSVAATICQYRTDRGLSQNELTRRAELPWGYVSQIERKKPDLTLDVLEKISLKLGVDIIDLLRPTSPIDLQPAKSLSTSKY